MTETAIPRVTVSRSADERGAFWAAWGELHRQAALLEMQAARLAAGYVRAQWPTARWLELDVTDQGGDNMTATAVHAETGVLEDELWDYDSLTELVGCLRDAGDWTIWRVYPFGAPARHTTGLPCLDITAVLSSVT